MKTENNKVSFETTIAGVLFRAEVASSQQPHHEGDGIVWSGKLTIGEKGYLPDVICFGDRCRLIGRPLWSEWGERVPDNHGGGRRVSGIRGSVIHSTHREALEAGGLYIKDDLATLERVLATREARARAAE